VIASAAVGDHSSSQTMKVVLDCVPDQEMDLNACLVCPVHDSVIACAQSSAVILVRAKDDPVDHAAVAVI
jgi:hypothetical protein